MPADTPCGTLLLTELVAAPGTSTLAHASERCRSILVEAAELEHGAVLEHDGWIRLLFPTAMAASSAAARFQARLSEPDVVAPAIRVRSALAAVDAPHYERAASRAAELGARLLEVGHGGQILLDALTAERLAQGDDGIELRDLGRLRLKDLGPPRQVFQLVVPGLRCEFPAPRSLDNPDLPNNLPTLLSPFVGRSDEVKEVRRLIEAARLVTLTGAGGAGKTRLALQAAAEALDGSGDGVWIVELAPVTDEQRVPTAIVSALQIPESDLDPTDVLVRSLSKQSTLLVLDNCEHLVDRVAKVVDLVLRACPGVQVLATSREPLGVDGERVYRVPSMSLPVDDVLSVAEVRHSDAASLFMDRAADVGASFIDEDAGLVASVCRRLDGIPLALELAAAQLTSLSLAELSNRLDQRFRLLTGGSRSAMARQQTLQALVDWSYDLLNPSERAVLQRLSVFTGPFDLAAAEAICVGERADEVEVVGLLHALVDKSLVIAEREGDATWYRLLETIRQYGAIELLRADGEDGVLEARDRHAEHYLGLARRAAPCLLGPDMGHWMRRLDREGSNLDAAVAHLVEDRPVDALRLITDLERFFTIQGSVEVLTPTLRAVSRIDHDDPQNAEVVAAGLLVACTTIGWHLIGRHDEMMASVDYVHRAQELAVRVRRTDLETRALTYQVTLALYRGDVAAAAELCARAEVAARQCGDDGLLCDVLVTSLHPSVVKERGLADSVVKATSDEALSVAMRSGDPAKITLSKFWSATQALQGGRLEEARRLFEETLELTYEICAFDGQTLNNYLIVCLAQGDFPAAVAPLQKCLRRMRRSGFRSNPGDVIAAGACVATSRGDHLAGAQLHGAADEIRRPAYATGELFRSSADEEMERVSVGRARAALCAEEFEKAVDEGRRMSMSQACDLALAVTR